jgi:hypothetical protein
VALLAASSASAAAVLDVDPNTVQLRGASGVVVDGVAYDAQFLDGTCIALFSGCDQASDFRFNTFAAAVGATQALLDQVYVDDISNDFTLLPEGTTGCESTASCHVVTPYELAPIPNSFGTFFVLQRSAFNSLTLGLDANAGGNFPVGFSSVNSPGHVYAGLVIVSSGSGAQHRPASGFWPNGPFVGRGAGRA